MLKYKQKKILILDNSHAQIKILLSHKDDIENINFINNAEHAIDLYSKNFFNLIIINISSHGSLEFLKTIKKISKNKPIILISDNIDTDTLNKYSSYHVDGIIFIPFLKDNFFKLIDNIFERQEEQDQLFIYFKEFEKNHFDKTKESLNVITHSLQEEIKHDHISKDIVIPVIDNYEQIDCISSEDFFEIFDDTIIDRVEELQLIINNFAENIFVLEQNKENMYIVIESFHKLSVITKEIAEILFYFQYFKIAGKAFLDLSDMFENINFSETLIENKEKIILFLRYLDKDLESWFYSVFIFRDAENVFYFDSSLLSNTYMLRSLLFNEEIQTQDIEFF